MYFIYNNIFTYYKPIVYTCSVILKFDDKIEITNKTNRNNLHVRYSISRSSLTIDFIYLFFLFFTCFH